MKKSTFAAILFFVSINAQGSFAQSYSDVMVIVNSNSTISQDVANYFKTQRSIPDQNVCTLAMPTTEEIDSTTYAGILSQIKAYMQSYGLTTSIKYIVTTQGVPLKVRRSSSVFSLLSNAGSFDSDLCLLNSSLESQIGKPGPVTNPYAYKLAHFTRTPTYNNIYLVTRLAGYTYSDIVGLIDRARMPYRSVGKFVLDMDQSKGAHVMNTNMISASNTLRSRGFNVLLDSTNAFVVNQVDVLGYVSWGSNDANWSSYTQKAQPHFTWSAKALADTYVSSSARSFSDSTFVEPTIGWQSMIADLIHENGVTGTKGYVWEPYTGAQTRVEYLYHRWTNTAGYNLADSYYMSSGYLSWMDVVIGDPKATFAGEGHLPVELVSFAGSLRNNTIHLTWKTATESNNHGFEVQKQVGGVWKALGFVAGMGTVNTPQHYTFTDNNVQAVNTYRLRQIDREGEASNSLAINVAGSPGKGFALVQNYPNPFNTVTSISFTLPEDASVSLRIYSITGQEVAALADAEQMEAGMHSAFWAGNDMSGTSLPSGRYICRMSATRGDATLFTDTRILTLMR